LFSNTKFKANSATTGGAIKFNSFKPVISEDVIFEDNKAVEYGDNIASYPYELEGIRNCKDYLVGAGSLRENYFSGEVITTPWTVKIKDIMGNPYEKITTMYFYCLMLKTT
jgi:hypothetical protein